MARLSIALLLALFASAGAFTMMPTARSTPLTRVSLMSQEETDSILNQANDCAEGECSLDEVDELIAVLKTQQRDLFKRVEEIRGMVKVLDELNSKDGRQVDEVRETVRAIFRVFQLGDKASGNDYPSLSKPTGWSGEVGNGPTTAYDALPPKPYKP